MNQYLPGELCHACGLPSSSYVKTPAGYRCQCGKGFLHQEEWTHINGPMTEQDRLADFEAQQQSCACGIKGCYKGRPTSTLCPIQGKQPCRCGVRGCFASPKQAGAAIAALQDDLDDPSNAITTSNYTAEIKRLTFERDRLASHVSDEVMDTIDRIDARRPNKKCADECQACAGETACIHCGHHVPAGVIQYSRFARLRHVLLWTSIIGWGPACAVASWLIHGVMR